MVGTVAWIRLSSEMFVVPGSNVTLRSARSKTRLPRRSTFSILGSWSANLSASVERRCGSGALNLIYVTDVACERQQSIDAVGFKLRVG